ncbi:uncharacterized protein BP01DRAFT_221501 [Aspergillus saccharolyticus JOP 1030-1]|uniref:Uncharacterized protein n=1 Tax=Aspergillus saccharolyticus JOP 1030-1 TaxID=1450539 RepID=A0A318Z251_9EURO|nr:hypothetical protein BP01DRAFT_221501 [Aspergillus saccharolyticus JOP 1030-1]PYH40357.1 hypothetical protein BP01DRAFT_221501 [Aspergillus saccharolyticus JOP 1030-1]
MQQFLFFLFSFCPPTPLLFFLSSLLFGRAVLLRGGKYFLPPMINRVSIHSEKTTPVQVPVMGDRWAEERQLCNKMRAAGCEIWNTEPWFGGDNYSHRGKESRKTYFGAWKVFSLGVSVTQGTQPSMLSFCSWTNETRMNLKEKGSLFKAR